MSRRKAVVEAYFEGFRRSDHQAILACLTDDVVWDLAGYKHLRGRTAFDQEIENDDFVGSPTLTVERVVEDGDTVVATGRGEAVHSRPAPSTGSRSATSSRSPPTGSAGSSRTSCP